MKRILLSESELVNLIKRVVNEEEKGKGETKKGRNGDECCEDSDCRDNMCWGSGQNEGYGCPGICYELLDDWSSKTRGKGPGRRINEGFLAGMLIYLLLDQLEDWIWGDDEGGDKVTNPNSWNDFKNKNKDTFAKLGASAPKSFADLQRMGRELDNGGVGTQIPTHGPRDGGGHGGGFPSGGGTGHPGKP